MPASEPVRLAWVLIEGRLRLVGAFAGVPAAERPAAACPVCGEAVVLKLGAHRAPHAAHRPDAPCPLQHEETALHYNTKQHLAAVLRVAAGEPGATIVVRQRCAERGGVLGVTQATPGLVPCPAFREAPFVAGWDEVRVERGLSDTRPDILLRADGAAIGVVEVRRTHAVTAAKIERLAAAGVPWIEVVASRALYAEFTEWRIDRPLVILRAHDSPTWRCEPHRRRARRRAGGVAHAPWMARVVDRYLPDGRASRAVLCVTGTVRGRVVATPALRVQGDDAPFALLADGARDAVLHSAHAAFLAWAEERRAMGERIDSPMPWIDAARIPTEGDVLVAGDALLPRRFRFDRGSGRWVRRSDIGARVWNTDALLPGHR